MAFENRFSAGRPASGNHFLSNLRAQITDDIGSALKSGNDVLLHSPPRLGKSSILNRLEDQLQNDYCMHDHYVKSSDDFYSRLKSYMESIDVRVSCEKSLPEYLCALDRVLEGKGKKLYILLDESHDFLLKEYKDLHGNMQPLANIRFCWAAQEKAFNLMSPDSLEGYVITALLPYTHDETMQLLRDGSMGVFNEDICERIFSISDGRPYVVGVLAHELAARYGYDQSINLMNTLDTVWMNNPEIH